MSDLKKCLNPSEAVYGFVAWLTTRKEQTILSSSNDCAPVCDLIKKFCIANQLPGVSENWPNHLIHIESSEIAVPRIGINQ